MKQPSEDPKKQPSAVHDPGKEDERTGRSNKDDEIIEEHVINEEKCKIKEPAHTSDDVKAQEPQVALYQHSSYPYPYAYTPYAYPPASQPPSHPPYNTSLNDPDETFYVNYFTQQQATQSTPGMLYEQRRAQNQMSAYFDTTKFPMAGLPAQQAKPPPPKKVTKADIERFKRRKEERKKLKNKWLYE